MRRLVIVVATLMLGACAQDIPPINFSVPNVGVSQHKVDAELKSLTVTMGRPDEQTGPINLMVETMSPAPGTGGVVTSIWRTSLEEAVNRMAVFNDDAKKKISLQVKVLKLDMPSAGGTFTTNTSAKYEIIDRTNGSIIYTQVIDASGTCPGDYAFMGAIRARESVNRSVQNNISLFLQALDSVDVHKPMFPSN